MVVVVDAHLANLVLGNGYKLSKALEPPLSDELLSLKGHPTMFSASTDSEYWALLRKGTAPALNPRNIRCANTWASMHQLPPIYLLSLHGNTSAMQ